MSDVFRATEPFAFTSKSGVPRVIRTGDLISSDDPDFKGREHLFEPAIASANRATETASAGPGDRRSRPRMKPDTADKPAEKPAQPSQPEHEPPTSGE